VLLTERLATRDPLLGVGCTLRENALG